MLANIAINARTPLRSGLSLQLRAYALRARRHMYSSNSSSRTRALTSYAALLPAHKYPALPVPDLTSTIQKYLASVRPLVPVAAFERTERIAVAFLGSPGSGPALQHQLQQHAASMHGRSWLLEWWTRRMYTRARSPLALGSSYALSLSSQPFTRVDEWSRCSRQAGQQHPVQSARAAALALASLRHRDMVRAREGIGDGNVAVDSSPDGRPLDPSQYHYLWHSCRVPGALEDGVRVYGWHGAGQRPARDTVAVLCRGFVFIVHLTVTGQTGQQQSPASLRVMTRRMAAVIDEADRCKAMLGKGKGSSARDAGMEAQMLLLDRCVPAMTGAGRDKWASLYGQTFGQQALAPSPLSSDGPLQQRHHTRGLASPWSGNTSAAAAAAGADALPAAPLPPSVLAVPASLEAVEASLCAICIDDSEVAEKTRQGEDMEVTTQPSHMAPSTSDDELSAQDDEARLRACLHGGTLNAGNRWWDKTVQWCVGPGDGGRDGTWVGFIGEHSHVDGQPCAAMVQWVLGQVGDMGEHIAGDDDAAGETGDVPVHRLVFNPPRAMVATANRSLARRRMAAGLREVVHVPWRRYGGDELKHLMASTDSLGRHQHHQHHDQQPGESSGKCAPAPTGTALGAARGDADDEAAATRASDLVGGHETHRTLPFAMTRATVSSDAWCHMAMQLAWHRASVACGGHGHPVATYEPASTRRFKGGRTAAIRCVSEASQAWVRAMPGAGSPLEAHTARHLYALLLTACHHHVQLAREAAAGHDVDRHLFGLETVWKQRMMMTQSKPSSSESTQGRDIASPAEPPSSPSSSSSSSSCASSFFRDPSYAASKHWTLCTSNLSMGIPHLVHGWAWSEVVPRGLGVAYSTRGSGFSFTIVGRKQKRDAAMGGGRKKRGSRRSPSNTAPSRLLHVPPSVFAGFLEQALADMWAVVMLAKAKP